MKNRAAIKPKTGVLLFGFGIRAASGELIRSIKKSGNDWVETDEEVTIYLPVALEPILKSKTRINVVLGGRGSSKSVNVHDIALAEVRDYGKKVMCIREYMKSIEDSVHSLLEDEIRRLNMSGFDIQKRANVLSQRWGYQVCRN